MHECVNSIIRNGKDTSGVSLQMLLGVKYHSENLTYNLISGHQVYVMCMIGQTLTHSCLSTHVRLDHFDNIFRRLTLNI